ncbi:hypothetical protein DEU34_1875 [Microbacterium sp. AG1240]|uniref:potassium transporter Kef n=1 Tax=Microbacterium sp. AG1240 TaxID=2183992 RepID=UPI000EB2D987|nr:potassium transporter Kef [Microbacterium sp. AG1240]RKT33285.1 hypothetical protein DEU34_1875 [Microbacterium sp. AG1240]
MIGWPRHLADDASDPGVGDAPLVDGVDLDTVAANVARLGGNADRFARRLSAALAAGPGDAEVARAAIALSAWRAGALALRDDALVRLRTLAGRRDTRAVAGGALGLDPETVPEFLARQAEDRFWWPERARWNGYVCAVGGFAGLGGTWIEPPTDPRTLQPIVARPADGPPVAAVAASGPSAFAVRTGGTWWRVDADVWGSRVTRTGDTPTPSAAVRTARVSLVTRPDSYLAWVHVRESA